MYTFHVEPRRLKHLQSIARLSLFLSGSRSGRVMDRVFRENVRFRDEGDTRHCSPSERGKRGAPSDEPGELAEPNNGVNPDGGSWTSRIADVGISPTRRISRGGVHTTGFTSLIETVSLDNAPARSRGTRRCRRLLALSFSGFVCFSFSLSLSFALSGSALAGLLALPK